MMDVDDEDPLCVLELTPEEKAQTREFHAAMAENITQV
jgi:hypothetical protein